MNFEVKGTTAFYKGPVNAASIASTLFEVMELAKTQDIQEFRFEVLNSEFDVVPEFHEFTAGRGLGKGFMSAEGDAVVIHYKLKRTQVVYVSAIGSTNLLRSLTVPEPIDLAHRVVTSPTTNGVESI